MASLSKVTDSDPIKTEPVKIRTSIHAQLESYRAFYQSVHSEPIDKSHLINELLKAWFAQDKDFNKFMESYVSSEVATPVPTAKASKAAK